MKKTALFLSAALAAATATAADYKIDPLHTNARFNIDHFATSTNVGGFYGLGGNMKYDAKAKSGSIDIRIPVANLQSSSTNFTGHLQSADLFDAAKYPEMRFVSTRFHFNGDKVTAVDGKLTLRGQTHDVQLKADKFNCYDSPMLKTQVCGGDFSTTIDRTRWGMDYLVNAGMSKDVRIDIQIEAAKQ